jgi:hypothetical protein
MHTTQIIYYFCTAGQNKVQISFHPAKMEKTHFKHPQTQSNKASTISSISSNQLKLLEQEFLLPTGPHNSNSLPDLGSISDLCSQMTTTSGSKSQVGRISVMSGETPSSILGGSALADLIQQTEKEGLFDISFSIASSLNSQKVISDKKNDL